MPPLPTNTADGHSVAGSYDHTVRLWDARDPSSAVATVQHGAPVESVTFLPKVCAQAFASVADANGFLIRPGNCVLYGPNHICSRDCRATIDVPFSWVEPTLLLTAVDWNLSRKCATLFGVGGNLFRCMRW